MPLEEENILRRWNNYFNKFMKKENERERRLDKVEKMSEKVKQISKKGVSTAIPKMKNRKAVASDNLPVKACK